MRYLLKSRRFYLALARLTYLTVLFVLNFCVGVSTTYCAVTDPATRWTSVKDTFTTTDKFALFVPQYQLRDGRLYLMVQVCRPSMILVMFVGFGDWDARKVDRFRQRHPGLRDQGNDDPK